MPGWGYTGCEVGRTLVSLYGTGSLYFFLRYPGSAPGFAFRCTFYQASRSTFLCCVLFNSRLNSSFCFLSHSSFFFQLPNSASKNGKLLICLTGYQALSTRTVGDYIRVRCGSESCPFSSCTTRCSFVHLCRMASLIRSSSRKSLVLQSRRLVLMHQYTSILTVLWHSFYAHVWGCSFNETKKGVEHQ